MAKRTEVLLVKDVLKLGNMGDLLKVAPGYARNYLYPYGMAIPAGSAAKRQVEVLREKAAKSEAEREAKANQLKKVVDGLTIQVAARVAHEDELFGSIGSKEIVAALAKKGHVVDTKQVHLHEKLRKLGRFPVEIRLHRNVPATVTVEVINSDPNAPSLDDTLKALAVAREAARKAAKEAKEAKPAAEGEAAAEPAADGKDAAKASDKKPDAAKTEKSEKNEKADKKGDKKGDAKPEGKADAKSDKSEKAEKAGKSTKSKA